jgi:ATP-binding cassette subfamily C (CFTR/MRP) protein 1
MEGGRISEQGSYASLLSSGAAFSRLIAEFGSANNHKASASSSSSSSEAGEDAIIEDVVAGGKEAKEMEEVGKETEKTVPGTKYGEKGAEGAKLMQSEERETGSVSSKVYTHYFQSMGSVLWAPALLSIYALAQIATVGNNIFLGFWR